MTLQKSEAWRYREVVHEYHYLRKVMTKNSLEYQFGKYTSYNEVNAIKNITLNKMYQYLHFSL